MPSPFIKRLGQVIQRQTVTSPDRARALLMAAYSWVNLAGKFQMRGDVRAATERVNGGIAGTIVDSFRRPQNAVMVNIFMPCELIHAMGLVPMFPEGLSAYIANTACEEVFVEASEANDIAETFCSYHKLMMGVAETGVMPRPLMIANTTLICDANQLSFPRLANYYDVPHYVIDVPSEQSEDSVRYVADQFYELAAMLEDLSGRRLDPESLREVMVRSRKTIETYQRALALRGKVSLDTTMTSELCAMISTHIMLGRPEALRFMEDLLKASEAALPRGKEDKVRLFWIHTLPNWQDSMRAILDAAPQCELVGTDIASESIALPDPDHPFETMARRLVYGSMNGPAKHRLELALEQAKDANADGVVVFCHWGCKQTLGISQMAKHFFEQAGLPTLVLDGDGCDSRNVADGQMVTRMNAFIEQLKAVRA
ncbi:2-hydroxyacyl-CoA dehydratase subunit D [Anaerotardibacter muris]|uniref:2-hydroxyacyl-CoA dehydratase subunit D n=1 Tax=Anaerotardibacter muris TaxID=2941505 RepID=UPI00203F4172|nr:2-hydroxyacyl-CoA dehydratase family protein [Anaerotardibacter muris]